MDSGSSGARRIQQLDVLRGVAVLMVMGYHFPWHPNRAGIFWPVDGLFHRIGLSGNDLFFVLSGFLIGGLLFREIRTTGGLDVKRFLVRRMLKIWPSYYVLVLFTVVLRLVTSGGDAALTFRELAPNIFHYQNYKHTTEMLPHTWSLAIEEHFYLVLPFLLLVMARFTRNPRRAIPGVPFTMIAIFLVCFSLGTWTINRLSLSPNWWQATHLRAHQLMFGVLIAYFYHYYPERLARAARWPALLVLTALVMLGLIAFRLGTSFHIGSLRVSIYWEALTLAYACLLLGCLYADPAKSLLGRLLAGSAGRGLAWVGVYSYPIYLWHLDMPAVPMRPLLDFGMEGALMNSFLWLTGWFIYAVAAICGGVAMSVAVERPVLALRDRLFPSRARIPAPSELTESAPLKGNRDAQQMG